MTSTGKHQLPDHVRTFNFYGADLKPMGAQYQGDCVFCGKQDHFYTDKKEGMWDCKVCLRKGNHITFLEQLLDAAKEETTDEDWKKLEDSRGIPRQHMVRRELAWAGGRWLVPVRADTGRVRDLRVYDFKQLIATAGCKVQLWGADRLAKSKSGAKVWLCEGEWDGLAMEWLLYRCNQRVHEDGRTIVVAVPGAGTFKEEWFKLFAGKDVISLFDNDEAGDKGAEKVFEKLSGIAKSMRFVHWPRSEKLGYDTRDYVRASLTTSADPKQVLDALEALCCPMPRTVKEDSKREKNAVGHVETIDFYELKQVFSSKIKMSIDMVDCLKIMMAVCLSNDVPGDPLWAYLVGPPGIGKTLLLSSLSETGRCLLRSTVTPASLVSGWKGEGDKDPSLIPKLKGLTFVAKDFTEILTMPQIAQDEVFSTLRGAYDGVVQKPFGNGVTREYKDCRFSMLAGVTHAIHACRNASLGERFLKFQYKKMEAEQAEAAVIAAIASIGQEVEMEKSLCDAASAFLARKVDAKTLPAIPKEFADRLLALVQLIAFLRAQVERDPRTNDVRYRPEPEAGTRLAKQLSKLAKMIALVEDKVEVDAEVYALVERVAYDTAHGFHLDVVDAMMRMGGEGTRDVMRKEADVSASTIGRYVDDLAILRIIVDTGKKTNPESGRPAVIYRITDKIAGLWARARGQSWTPKSSKSPTSTPKLTLKRTSTSRSK